MKYALKQNTLLLAPAQDTMMMHMWMWFGYDLGEFMFPGLNITTRWSFALTWIALFFVALLFEGSKVYLARVQREAQKKLNPFRSDERRNLLCDRERLRAMEPTTSRNASSGQVNRCSSLRMRMLVNCHQSSVFLAHNVVGYLLMLAVMVYNVHLLLAVVFGMMLGYFLFGTRLTRLQMQCFGVKRAVICTPECDDTAETSTPPLLDSANSSESDLFVCRTRTCIRPSHYFRAGEDGQREGGSGQREGGSGQESSGSCSYGANRCPSLVARVRPTRPPHKEGSPTAVEDAQLISKENQGCCKTKSEEKGCSQKSSHEAVVHDVDRGREGTPHVSCCRPPAPSQERFLP